MAEISTRTGESTGATREASPNPVLVVGAGPVGMTLALDLAWRGVPVLLLEQSSHTTTNPRCNTTNSRSMEYFRRLGVADMIRRAGLPLDHPTDVVYTTSILGHELTRFEFSSAAQVLAGTAPEYADWPTPELQHRISQIYLEPILAAELERFPTARVRRDLRVETLTQDQHGVTVIARDTRTEREHRFRADYVVGCDGGASAVRRAIGSTLRGDSAVGERRVSVYFRSEELTLPGRRPGWMYWWYGPRYRGSFVQLDGQSLYLCHGRVPEGEDLADADPDEILRCAIGRDIAHEKIDVVRWTPRRLIADRFRDRRILLAGDAAHIWLPLGGFGMNTGIADAVGLGWRLAALHNGWGCERLLDDYVTERRSVGEATSNAAKTINSDTTEIGRDPRLHQDTSDGADLRAQAARTLRATDRKQWYSLGVQLGARYQDSPGLAEQPGHRDESEAISRIDHYRPSVRAGARLPHCWLGPDNESVFDKLGPEFTLLRIGPGAPRAAPFHAAATRIGLPLTVVDLPESAAETYHEPLVLVRPDWYVAWSGAHIPDCDALLEALRGATVHQQRHQPLNPDQRVPTHSPNPQTYITGRVPPVSTIGGTG